LNINESGGGLQNLNQILKEEVFMSLQLSQKGKQIIINNGFWEVIHDLRKGGCICSIRIFNGSGKNILVSPIASYFSQYSEIDWVYPDFRDEKDRDAKAEILKKSSDRIDLQVKAKLIDINLGPLGIEVETIYEYHNAYIKVHRIFRCRKKIPDIINVVGIGSIETIPELDYWCARNSSRREINETAREYATLVHMPIARWGRVESSNYPSYIEFHPSHYLCVFNRGVEGIETFPNSNLKEWERGLVPDGDRCARFAIYKKFNPTRTVIICEPHFGLWVKPLKLKGEYRFTSYLGIPNVSPKGVNKKYMWINGVLRINKNRWASEDEIKEMAKSGVQIIIHHHDSPYGHGLWPDGSFFWPDGKYPPYEPVEMKNLERSIHLVHKYGMKIIPYFNPFELHPFAEVFKKNIYNWARMFGKKRKLFHNYTKGGEYGVAVCMQSGFADFLKSYIKKVITTLGFDGAYFDGISSAYCNNLRHADWEHTTVDGMIELVEYTRELVGKEGIIVTHQTASPYICVENLVDISVIMEDVSGYPSFQKGTPELDCFTPYCDFVNVAHKAICAYTALRPGCPEDEIKKMMVRCAVKGLSFYSNQHYPYWREISLRLAGRDMSEYKFEDYRKNLVVIDNPKVKGALYKSTDEIIVVLGNTESPKEEHFSWSIDLNKCGWKEAKINIVSDKQRTPQLEIYNNTINISDSLNGYEFKFYYLKKLHDKKLI